MQVTKQWLSSLPEEYFFNYLTDGSDADEDEDENYITDEDEDFDFRIGDYDTAMKFNESQSGWRSLETLPMRNYEKRMRSGIVTVVVIVL